MKVLYSNGDSWSFGTDLNPGSRENDRWSAILSDKMNMIDFNVATSGTSNDRIFRTTLRDICLIKDGKNIWSEKTGNIGVKLEDLYVVIGWSSPTRFEYYNKELNQWKQMRHDIEDEWGFKPGDRDYDNQLLKDRFGSLKGMYSKWLSSIVSLHHILNSLNIRHLFFNAFYPMNDEIDKVIDELQEIDTITSERTEWDDYDNHHSYFGLVSLWNNCPQSFRTFNAYRFLSELEYPSYDDLITKHKHPTELGHEYIAKHLWKLI